MSSKNADSDIKQGLIGGGGLLANVSLLTTGGSSLQHQLTNNDMQLTSTRNQTIAGGTLQQKDEAGSGKINTSTPARPLLNSNVVYGFDLSPVHSYEMPTTFKKDDQGSIKASREKNIKLISQDKFENDLFVDRRSKAAPNFMQAPSVISPHQSRISTRASDDTETMMSQVYSLTPQSKSTKCQSPRPSKKSSKSTKSNQKSPYVSPRKTSKSYSHINGSGYGLNSPWKPSLKTKPEDKKKSVLIPKKKVKNKKKHVQVVSNTSVSQPSVGSPKRSFDSAQLRNLSGTYKVERKNIEKFPTDTALSDFPLNTSQLSSYKQDLEYKNLEDRFNALEKEYSLLKAGHTEVNKENFLLSAKLNKLVKAADSTDPVIKDSLNDDHKTTGVTILKKEVLEQERLLKGYQQENEKLYNEMAKMKKINRENESAMFNENLKLKNKLASLNEELRDKDAIIREKNQLLLDERNLKPRRHNRSIQTEQILKNDSNEKADYLKELHDKLSWYADNKLMLEEKCRDYDKAMENVVQLKMQIASLNKQTKENNSETLNESRRTEDLHRQVKELENIVSRSQTADHVKTLIHGDDDEKELMRQHTKQLELRLKKQEESFSNSMQSLHRLYKKMSADYEERVNNLSNQLDLLKQRNFEKPVQQQAAMERMILMKQENSELKLQIETLQSKLYDEREKNKELANKMKKIERNDSTKFKPGSVYHPGYFIEKPSLPVEDPIKPLDRDVITPQKLKQAIDKEHQLLSKEILHWKDQYEKTKSSCAASKNKYESEIQLLKTKFEETIKDLQRENAALDEKANIAELKLSRALVDLSSSKTCEEALQLQIKNLLDELHETRRGSSNATIRQLQSLQNQIKVLNFRQKSREEKLDQVAETSADEYLRSEINSLRNVISDKDLLLTKFRCELDAILRVLENLQREKLTSA